MKVFLYLGPPGLTTLGWIIFIQIGGGGGLS